MAAVPVFRDLAWLGLFWLVGTGAVVGLLLPVLLFLVRGPGGSRSGQIPGPSVAVAPPGVSSGKGRSLLLGLLAVLLVLGGLSATTLEVGDNVPGPSYIRPGHSWNACFRLMAEKFMGPYQLLVYVKANEEGGLLDPEALHEIGDFSRYLRKQAGARDSIAFDMMVKSARNMMMDGNPKWETVPLSREQVKGMGELVVDQGGVEELHRRDLYGSDPFPLLPRGRNRTDRRIRFRDAGLYRPASVRPARLPPRRRFAGHDQGSQRWDAGCIRQDTGGRLCPGFRCRGSGYGFVAIEPRGRPTHRRSAGGGLDDHGRCGDQDQCARRPRISRGSRVLSGLRLLADS